MTLSRQCAPSLISTAFIRTTSAPSKTSERFPFTAKSDLRANYPFGLFAVPKDQLARIHASSGTTGKPTVVGYTQ